MAKSKDYGSVGVITGAKTIAIHNQHANQKCSKEGDAYFKGEMEHPRHRDGRKAYCPTDWKWAKVEFEHDGRETARLIHKDEWPKS